MRIRYTNPSSKDTVTEAASFTTDDYNQAVLVTDSELFDPVQWVALNAVVVEASPEECDQFIAWLRLGTTA